MTTSQLLPTDHELICEFADSGADRPFELLVRRHGGLVLGVCRAILRDATDAEDAAQAAFLTLARKAPSLRSHHTIAGWLHQVACNVARRAREARRLRQQREREAATLFEARAATETSEPAIAAEIHRAIQSLPERYRLPLILHHLEGWSEQEVAQILDCKLGTVSGRLSRGREMLRDDLESRRKTTLASLGLPVAITAPDDRFVSNVARAGSSLRRGGQVPIELVSAHAAALAEGAGLVDRPRRGWLIATILALLLVIGAIWALVALRSRSAPSGPPVVRSNVDTTAVHGLVVDPDGNPAAGVTVRLYRSKEDATGGRRAIAQVVTASDGSFSFDRLSPTTGGYLLCFIQQPVFMHGEANVDVVAARDADAGTIVLKTGRY
jgi:RNA polymerase sigma factor (sigma-70 family)